MTIDIQEKQFENHIEHTLLEGGYIKRSTENFDRKSALDIGLLIQFLKDTQLESYKKLESIYGSELEYEILRRLKDSLEDKGMIHILRNGFRIADVILECAYFKPVSKRNPEAEVKYNKNILSIIRQATYSENNGKSIDLLLCLNGLPVATAEIKNPVTGQGFEDAIRQYKQDRDPKEKLFEFRKRALVHFAIDPYQIFLTTHLNGDKTHFIPFNKGRNGRAGNPDNIYSYRTSYLWKEIWRKDIWLEIIGNFIDLQIIEQKQPLPSRVNLIFPRYHQLESVLALTEATKETGSGRNYLIQHSPGSGKSNTIAWLAYKLFSLHNSDDNSIFDGIIILSDRIGIVSQLAKTIRQFEQMPGTIDEVKSSSDLAENLQTGRKILISTQQKFPLVLEKLNRIKGKYFAIIIDEAHSSQTGESARKVKAVLTTNLEEESREELEEEDLVDKIEKEMQKRGPQQNLSYYAFTATPKKKTLRLFGTPQAGENYIPFHTYPMRQAIEEGFILDILKNYTTYERFFRILQVATEDKVVDGKKASRALMKYVDGHHLNLSNNARIIVEHFRTHCQPKIGGLAKAMVVSSLRVQAIKYKQEIDEYIKSQNYHGIKTLVAFSGTIKDELGNTYTEQNINKTSTELELREKFNSSEYNILIVAEKYQTGYDQPLLHTMYIDKKLYGIKAVQTLSRLNRTHPGKTDTFVVDFRNTIDEITRAFEPYYNTTMLVDRTDPAHLFRLYDLLMNYDIITKNDLDNFAKIYFKPRSSQDTSDHGRLYALIDPVLDRYNATSDIQQDEFRQKVVEYIESYSFLTQIVSYDDTDLEKLFVLSKFIASENLLIEIGSQIPELRGDVSLQWYRLERTHIGDLAIGGIQVPIVARDDLGKPREPEVLTALSEVIQTFNDRYGIDFPLSDTDKSTIEQWFKNLENDPSLRYIAQENEFEDFLLLYEAKLQDEMVHSLSQNQYLVSKIFSDADLKKKITVKAATLYHNWAKKNDLPPITPETPSQNRSLLRQTIRSCKDFIYWIDLYFNKEGLEFLMDSFDNQNVKEIKLLTSLYNNENQVNEEFRSRLEQFQNEIKQKGISLEMRLISTKNAYERVSHDRFIIGRNTKYNVPSFTTLTKGRFSEIKKTNNDIPFMDYWNNIDSIDIIKDWTKIKDVLDKTNKRYEANCSACGKRTSVRFRPDGFRPVYCRECLGKSR